MGSKYPILPLVDLVTIHDTKRKPITKSKRVPGNYPYYGASGITDYVEGFVFDGLYVLLAEDGDNLRTRNTPIAFIAQGKFWVNNHAHVLKGIDDLDTQYICYALQYAEIESYISGSTRPKITQGDLKKIPISAPSIEIRHAIAKFISEFDKKIELNQQTNHTLEQMAQALFKSWFVDFDPVFDNLLASVDFKLENLESNLPDELKQKAQRRLAALDSLENATECKASLIALAHELQAQSPTQAAETPVKANFTANPNILAQHANTHAHFPNEFEHNEQLGWIPKGWSLEVVSKYCEKVQNGGTPKRNEPTYWENGTIPWLTSGEVRQSIIVEVKSRISEVGLNKSSAKWVPKFSTLVALYGATAGEVSLNSFALTTNQAVCALIPSSNYSWFNYLSISRKVSEFQNKAVGSAQQNISKGLVENKLLLYPNVDLVIAFNCKVEALFTKTVTNLNEVNILAKLRDTLLPKLISGELQIPDVATHEKVID